MPRYRGRFGLPALTTTEAVGVCVLAVATGILVTFGVERLFKVHVPWVVHRAVVFVPLLLVAMTPKKRRQR